MRVDNQNIDVSHQEGLIMNTEPGEMCKAQVIYYLNRNGKMEPPHMIEVVTSSLDGLRLKDVKKRLNCLRGSGMSNLFSWSYKRNYRSKCIWQDLSDEDVMEPGNGGEYILKGSEIIDDNQEKYLKPSANLMPESRRHLESESKYRGAEIWLKPECRIRETCKSSLCIESKPETELIRKVSDCVEGQSSGVLSDLYDHEKTAINHTGNLSDDKQATGKCFEKNQSSTDCKISSSNEDSTTSQFQDIKVYKIKPSLRTDEYSCEASTQTEGNVRRAASKSTVICEQSMQFPDFSKVLTETLSLKEKKLNYVTQAAESSIMAGKIGSRQNIDKIKSSTSAKKLESTSNVKFKQSPSSWFFLHILSCGSVDTEVQKQLPHIEAKAFNYNGSVARGSSEVVEMSTAQASPQGEIETFRLISRSSSFSSRRSAFSHDLESKLEKTIKDIGFIESSKTKLDNSEGIADNLYDGSKDIRVSTVHVKSSDSHENDHVYATWLHQHNGMAHREY